MLHLHIQKNNVVDRAVILQNIHAVRKDRHFKLCPVLPGIPPDILLQYSLHLRVVLYDRHPDHDRTSLTTPLWNCYGSIIAQSRPVCQGASAQRAGQPTADHRGRQPLPAGHGSRQPDHQPHREPEPSGHKDHRAAQAHSPGELLPAGGAALGSAFSAIQCPLPGAAAQRLIYCPQSRQRKKRCILRGDFYAQKAQKNARPPVENHGGRAFCVLLFVPL